jgi:hypothetical protein
MVVKYHIGLTLIIMGMREYNTISTKVMIVDVINEHNRSVGINIVNVLIHAMPGNRNQPTAKRTLILILFNFLERTSEYHADDLIDTFGILHTALNEIGQLRTKHFI